MNTIRWGIIGCGSMGREHILNLAALGGAEVTALADPFEGSRTAALALCDEARFKTQVFHHHQELLQSGLCDAVAIATPNFTHAAILQDALATDLHILVEKPLVTRIEDGLDLLARAEGRSALTWVAQEYRYMPPVAEMIRLAHEGAVGRLLQVAIREHREPFYPKVGDWNRFSANTGGTLVEKCCHYFNLMDHILQERPSRVFAQRRAGREPPRRKLRRKAPRHPGQRLRDRRLPQRRARPSGPVHVRREHRSTTNTSPSSATKASSNRCCPRACCATAGARTGAGARSGASPRAPAGAWPCARCATPTSSTWASTSAPATSSTSVLPRRVRNGTPAEIGLEEGLRSVATGLAAHRSIAEGRVWSQMNEVLP